MLNLTVGFIEPTKTHQKEMKRLFLSLCAIGMAFTTCHAEDFNYLTVTSSTVEQSFALDQVRRITFNGDNMVVTANDGNTSNIALNTLTSITFTSTATAIRNLSTESCKSMQLLSDRVIVNGKGLLKLYNTNGMLVRQVVVGGSTAELNLEGLPHGIYIARLGTQNLKILH